jgi:uncharacterized membrane protein
MSKGRIEAFSDGVFAIAITLLILEIEVPHVAPGERLWSALADLWPSYAAYLVSFVTIGIIWVNHHGIFTAVTRIDRPLLFMNLLVLLWVAFLPFPTAVVAEYLRDAGEEPTAAAVYAATFLAMNLSFYACWWYALRAGLVHEAIDDHHAARLRRRNLLGIGAYAVSIGLAFVSAPASLALDLLVAVYYVLPGRLPAMEPRVPAG